MGKKKLIGILILLLVIGLFLVVHNLFFWGNTVQISNARQKETLILSSKNDKVHYIRIIITGNIDGNTNQESAQIVDVTTVTS